MASQSQSQVLDGHPCFVRGTFDAYDDDDEVNDDNDGEGGGATASGGGG